MAATFEWDEYNGAGGTPTHGVTNVNWKNVDDTATAYTASPITAGNNSFWKVQGGHFQGTYNQILNGLWSAHTSDTGGGNIGTGISLVGKVSTTYEQPATTALTGSTSFTAVVAIGSGTAVQFAASAGGSMTASTTSNPAYTQYLFSQLQTTGSAGAGDTVTITATLQYDEN